jgi:hypothetical protein
MMAAEITVQFVSFLVCGSWNKGGMVGDHQDSGDQTEVKGSTVGGTIGGGLIVRRGSKEGGGSGNLTRGENKIRKSFQP